MKPRHLSVFAILFLAGCSKIHEQRAFTLPSHGGNTLSISAPISEQKIVVSVTSDQTVSVWILLEKDVPTGDKSDFDPDATMKTGILAKEKFVTTATLQATVPAKQAFQIFVVNRNNVAANVTVKVDSQ